MTVLPKLQADLNRADRQLIRRRRRRRRAARATTVTAIAIAAIAAPLITISSQQSPGPAGLLGVAAAKAAGVPAGSFGAFTVSGVTAIMSVGDERPYNVLAPYTRSVTPVGHGAYEQRSAPNGPPQFLGPDSQANFETFSRQTDRDVIRDIVPTLPRRLQAGFYVGPYGESKPVPTIDELRREMQDLKRRSAWSGPAREGPGASLAPNGKPSGLDLVMPYVLALLAGPTVPTEIRAEVFRALEATDGVRVEPNAIDHDGRTGVGIVRDFDDGQGLLTRMTIVYDATTTRILGAQTQVLENDRRNQSNLANPGLHPGDIIEYSTYHYAD